jgi:hypothetical protein
MDAPFARVARGAFDLHMTTHMNELRAGEKAWHTLDEYIHYALQAINSQIQSLSSLCVSQKKAHRKPISGCLLL